MADPADEVRYAEDHSGRAGTLPDNAIHTQPKLNILSHANS